MDVLGWGARERNINSRSYTSAVGAWSGNRTVIYRLCGFDPHPTADFIPAAFMAKLQNPTLPRF